MPTALTTATAREDLIEQTIFIAAMVAATQRPNSDAINGARQRLAAVTARYLNTMRLHPDEGEEQHDELHAATVRLIDRGLAIGINAANRTAHADGKLDRMTSDLPAFATAYMGAMYKLHSPSQATGVLAPAPAPSIPADFNILKPARRR